MSNFKRIKLKRTTIFSLVLLLTSFVVVFLNSDRIRSYTTSLTSEGVIVYSTDSPSEKAPSKNFNWKGKANDPKSIKIDSVGIEGFLQKVGVDQNQQIAVPNNVYFAGWFVDTVRPGENGLSIIDGHLNGTSKGGIFRNLENSKKDDQFEVKMGDDSVKKFVVKDVLTVNNDQAVNVLFSQDPAIKSQLNLITCGGTYDKAAHHYDQRIIVIAEYLGDT
ncbi:MAG: class F sortase [bacterium]